jgi:hypothetical protein
MLTPRVNVINRFFIVMTLSTNNLVCLSMTNIYCLIKVRKYFIETNTLAYLSWGSLKRVKKAFNIGTRSVTWQHTLNPCLELTSSHLEVSYNSFSGRGYNLWNAFLHLAYLKISAWENLACYKKLVCPKCFTFMVGYICNTCLGCSPSTKYMIGNNMDKVIWHLGPVCPW